MTTVAYIREYLLGKSPWVNPKRTVDKILFGDEAKSVAKAGVCWYPSGVDSPIHRVSE